jgi:hypothetical protein
MSRRPGWCLVLLLVVSCGKTPPPAPVPQEACDLGDWEAVSWEGSGEVRWDAARRILFLGAGSPMTLVKWAGAEAELPSDCYEISWEARRLEGVDFFCGLTFPVGSRETCLTFIAGGWRGQVTGLSNVGGYDASENQTRVWVPFENTRWYHFRVEVTPGWIRVDVDGRQVIGLYRPDKVLTMRSGEMEFLRPLGFGTWRSAGEIRNPRLRRLPSPER